MKKKKVFTPKPGKNQFFDIKPLKDWTLFVFPISMTNIDTKQSVGKCIKYVSYFNEKKVGAPKLGLNVVYGDFLYLNSDEKAKKLKKKFMVQMAHHNSGIKKAIYKRRKEFQIQHAFNFESWSNLYLQVKGNFNEYLLRIKKIYEKDKLLQKYIKEDAKFYKRKLDKNQLDFFLEEHLMFYLISYGMIHFRNEYVQGRERNRLICYPGVPPKAVIYFLQKNPFKFKTDNLFVGQYNLLNKKFYDANNFDLETWDYK